MHGPACAWFLEIILSTNVGVCVCVCPPPRALTTSHLKGMHNNQIRQFYSLSVSIVTLAINKLNEFGLSNTVHRECLPKKTKVKQYWLQKDYQGVPASRNVSIIKVSGQMHSNTFKRRLGFHFTVIILTQNNFILIIKLRHESES